MKFKFHTREQINNAIDKLENSHTDYWAYIELDKRCPYCGKRLECDIDIVWCENGDCTGFSKFRYENKIGENQ